MGNHNIVKSWYPSDFPYDEDELSVLTTLYPPRYWFAVEHDKDGDVYIHLMERAEGDDE